MAESSGARDGTIGLDVRAHEGTLVVAVSGELDLTTADLLGDALTSLLESESFLIVDLAQVTFADSAGLAPIVEASLWAERDGGAVQVVDPPRVVTLLCEVLPHIAEALGFGPRPCTSRSS